MSATADRFVGRHAGLDALRAEMASARAGAGRLVLLAGEPGIGKTGTASAFAAEARGLGVTVAWGRCHDASGAPTYWPWTQALQAYVSEHPDVATRKSSPAAR